MKTTLLGIATIIAALSSAIVSFLTSGNVAIPELVTSLTAGAGLIMAKDQTSP